MKRIIKLLKTQLSRGEALAVADPLNSSKSVNDDELDLLKDTQDLVSDTPPSDNGEYELEVTMGDVTVPILTLDDPSSSDADKSSGFDPYVTVKLHKQ